MAESRVEGIEGTLTVPTTGLTIHYRNWGGPDTTEGVGGPPVLLLHGLASTCRIYDLCAPLLAARHRVVAYDQRGHGETDKPDDGYDNATLVADGVGLAEALDITPPYIVAGHSWGASVALEWAVRWPRLVHAAVLVDGGISSFRDVPGATWEEVERRFVPRWPAITLDEIVERSGQGDLGFLGPDFRRAFFQAMTCVQPDGTLTPRLSHDNHRRIVRSMWETDVEGQFRALRRPATAVLAQPGSPDPEADEWYARKRRAAERLRALQPLLHVRWVENGIHDLPLQHPDYLATVIDAL